ncbi:MAG: HutD family protein [Deltaproteobacteria bacterium]|nr:HutD family protein [Deltaproteobacteria bacterium]
MAIIPESEWRVQPWKNGGGITREILRWPDNDDYDVRVSLADVTKNGPFSQFPGYKRFLVWIGPNPIDLILGRAIHSLTTPNATMEINGMPDLRGVLPAGPTRLLNLFVKDGAYDYGHNVPVKPVRFAFVSSRLEANVFDPPERITDRCLWIA